MVFNEFASPHETKTMDRLHSRHSDKALGLAIMSCTSVKQCAVWTHWQHNASAAGSSTHTGRCPSVCVCCYRHTPVRHRLRLQILSQLQAASAYKRSPVSLNRCIFLLTPLRNQTSLTLANIINTISVSQL